MIPFEVNSFSITIECQCNEHAQYIADYWEHQEDSPCSQMCHIAHYTEPSLINLINPFMAVTRFFWHNSIKHVLSVISTC